MFKLNFYSAGMAAIFSLSLLIPFLDMTDIKSEVTSELTDCDIEILSEYAELLDNTYECKWDNSTRTHDSRESCFEVCYDCYEILYFRISQGYNASVAACETQACKDELWDRYVENHNTYVELRNACIDKCNAIY